MEAILKAAEDVEDLCLDGDVQGGNRLVGNDKLGLAGEGAGDADALALASAELMGKAIGLGGVEADVLEKLVDMAADFARAAHAPDAEREADDLLDGLVGVERGEGILKDHLHPGAEAAEVRGRQREQVDAVKPDAAAGRLFEAADEATECSLAAAAFADEAEGLAASDLERDTVDGPQDALLASREVLGQILGFEQDVVGVHLSVRCFFFQGSRRDVLRWGAKRREEAGGASK